MTDKRTVHGQLICISYVFPPIPDRRFDYCAWFDTWGEEGPCGAGRTEEEAILDLFEVAQMGDWFDDEFWTQYDASQEGTAQWCPFCKARHGEDEGCDDASQEGAAQ